MRILEPMARSVFSPERFDRIHKSRRWMKGRIVHTPCCESLTVKFITKYRNVAMDAVCWVLLRFCRLFRPAPAHLPITLNVDQPGMNRTVPPSASALKERRRSCSSWGTVRFRWECQVHPHVSRFVGHPSSQPPERTTVVDCVYLSRSFSLASLLNLDNTTSPKLYFSVKMRLPKEPSQRHIHRWNT